MPYREDEDAAIARADALQVDVDRLEEERDQLAAERDHLAAERDHLAAELAQAHHQPSPARRKRASTADPTPPRPQPPQDRAATDPPDTGERAAGMRRLLAGGLGLLALIGLVVAVSARDCQRDRAHSDWRARDRARRHQRAHWTALTSVEPCVRRVSHDAVMALRMTPDRFDPRHDDGSSYAINGLVGNCTDGARTLVADPVTRPAIRAELQRWLDVERDLAEPVKALAAYYSHRDWVEDDGRGAGRLWAAVTPWLDRRAAVVARLRAGVLPALRDQMRAWQRLHLARAGRDPTWWRIELGLALWDIDERIYQVGGTYAGRELDQQAAAAAVHDPAARLREHAADAPLEVRRDLRKIDWVLDPLAAGRPLTGEMPLWHLAGADADLLRPTHDQPPALPPDPGPEPPSD